MKRGRDLERARRGDWYGLSVEERPGAREARSSPAGAEDMVPGAGDRAGEGTDWVRGGNDRLVANNGDWFMVNTTQGGGRGGVVVVEGHGT